MFSKFTDFLQKLTRTDIRYFIKGMWWFAVQHAGGILTAIAVSYVFANYLPKETYGNYRYALSLFALLSITTLTRADDSLAISVSKGYEGDFKHLIGIRMLYGAIGTIAGLAVAAYYLAGGDSMIAALAALVAVFVPLFDPPTSYNGLLIGKQKFKKMAAIGVITNLIYSIVIIVTVFLTKNVVAIVASYIFINMALRGLMLLYVIKSERPNSKSDPRTISYGKKLSFIDVLSGISGELDSILLYHYLGAADLAAYTFIKRVPEQLKFLPKYATTLSTPKFSTKDISDPNIKRETMRKSWFMFWALAAGAVMYIASAPYIFEYLFNPYKEYVFLSQIYVLGMPLNFGGLFLNFLETSRKESIVTKLNVSSPLLRIAIIFVSVKYFGLTGLVLGFPISRMLITFLRMYFFYKA